MHNNTFLLAFLHYYKLYASCLQDEYKVPGSAATFS